MKKEYYVYVYLDPRKKAKYQFGDYKFDYEPFYIGKGKNYRFKEHLKLKGNNYKKNKLIKEIFNVGLKPIIKKIKTSLTDEEAINLEIELIKLIGRLIDKNGFLTNLTDGGEGHSGFKQSDETKLKRVESLKKSTFYETVRCQEFRDLCRKNALKRGKENKGLKRKNKSINPTKYRLLSPIGDNFYIEGNEKMRYFCKENKLQYHTLKNNLNVRISNNETVGTKIFAKNTIGWVIFNMDLDNVSIKEPENVEPIIKKYKPRFNRRKKYIFIDRDKNETIVYGEKLFTEKIKEFSLSLRLIKKSLNKGIIKNVLKNNTSNIKNTIGWEVKKIN